MQCSVILVSSMNNIHYKMNFYSNNIDFLKNIAAVKLQNQPKQSYRMLALPLKLHSLVWQVMTLPQLLMIIFRNILYKRLQFILETNAVVLEKQRATLLCNFYLVLH